MDTTTKRVVLWLGSGGGRRPEELQGHVAPFLERIALLRTRLAHLPAAASSVRSPSKIISMACMVPSVCSLSRCWCGTCRSIVVSQPGRRAQSLPVSQRSVTPSLTSSLHHKQLSVLQPGEALGRRGIGGTPNVGSRRSGTHERCKEDQQDPLVAAALQEEGSVLHGRLEPGSDACRVVGVLAR